MLYQTRTERFTLRGISLGGMYTSIYVPELKACFDIGLATRSMIGCRKLFLSHGHVDHSGALPTLLGMRALVGNVKPLQVYLPEEIADIVQTTMDEWAKMQRYDLNVVLRPMAPGDELDIGSNQKVRAFRTFHPVPSLGFAIVETVNKLKPEYLSMPGEDIKELKRKGDDIFDSVERYPLAYATDTLVNVLEQETYLADAELLILECTFLDKRKSLKAARAGCHIHLDELIERADYFNNKEIVLMHFSQLYEPAEIETLLKQRLPEHLSSRVTAFVPDQKHWPM